ncbi:MAG: tripartite tricarboxylate transporter TctB family protein [Stappiaceae bacterium]
MTPFPVQRARVLGDLILSALVLGGAAILFIGAADLPPPRFEPLGSAAMPRILAFILVVLSVIVALRALLSLRFQSEPTNRRQRRDVPETPDPTMTNKQSSEAEDSSAFAMPLRGLAVLATLILYVAALDFGRVPFVPATTVFVMIAGMTMQRIDLRGALTFAGLGLVLSLILNYVFSTFLYIEIG